MYASRADVLDLYGADFVETIAAGGDLERGLTDASGFCDTYICGRYPLPLAETPVGLRDVCIDIALYKIARNGGGWTEDGRKRYEDALRWLRDIAKGDANLFSMKTQDDTGAVSGVILTDGPPRLFGRPGLKDW